MKISASVEYGARVLLRLARLDPGRALSAEKISSFENIPRAYVDQIFHRLRRAGLVKSLRGAYGGYALARRPEDISVGMLVRAMQSRVFEDACGRYLAGAQRCGHGSDCGIRSVWQNLSDLVEDYLERLTLADLLVKSKALCASRSPLERSQRAAMNKKHCAGRNSASGGSGSVPCADRGRYVVSSEAA